MSNLNDNTSEAVKVALEKVGAFFIEDMDDYTAKKEDGVKYALVATGLVCPSVELANFKSLLASTAHESPVTGAVADGCEIIIRKELLNREAFFTDDIDDAVAMLSRFGFSFDDVAEVHRKGAELVGF